MLKKFLFLVVSLFSFVIAFAAVNINTATQQDFESLNGIGPAKAKAIVDYRTEHGPFKTVDDIKNVKGIGQKTFDKLKEDLTISGTNRPTTAAAPAKKESAATATKPTKDTSDKKAKQPKPEKEPSTSNKPAKKDSKDSDKKAK